MTLKNPQSLLAIIAVSFAVLLPPPAEARYADDFDGTYSDLNCAEDDCDCLEPDSNRFKVVSPCNLENSGSAVVFTGAADEVQDFFDAAGQTDGLTIVPPTPVKVDKFMRYTPFRKDEVIASPNGRPTTAYQVAANAVLAGCSADLLPVCIALVQAFDDTECLAEISDGRHVPLAFVNGPVGRQICVDNEQGMTTEEVNLCLARFIELALINLAGVDRGTHTPFGSVQALVFSENDAACLAAGWQPYHVQRGHALNDSTVTLTSFAMWGNNLTPATDWPEEIMKLVAWDVTEKNFGAVGGETSAISSDTKRTILITPPVAKALSTLYKTKESLAGDLSAYARRPLALRALAYYLSDTDGVLSAGMSLEQVYDTLCSRPAEDARITESPAWFTGFTNPKAMTVATLKAENTRILVTGDASRNKTQVMPGGKSVTVPLHLSSDWDSLLAELQRKDLTSLFLAPPPQGVTTPIHTPRGLADGIYRILDPALSGRVQLRAGQLFYNATENTLVVYPLGAAEKETIPLDPEADANFTAFIENLGYNSSFRIASGKITESVIRFSSNERKLENNTVALTHAAFAQRPTLHANNVANSRDAGAIAINGANVKMSASITTFDVSLDGEPLLLGDDSRPGLLSLDGTTVTVDTSAPPGSSAILGVANGDGTYRTLTLVLRANGTYDLTYAAAESLSVRDSTRQLTIVSESGTQSLLFSKSESASLYTLTVPLAPGTYRLQTDDGAETSLSVEQADHYDVLYDIRSQKLTITRDITHAGICTGGTVENIAGVYVIRPQNPDGAVNLTNLTDQPRLAVEIADTLISGDAFQGFANGTTEGAFSFALKPAEPLDCAREASAEPSSTLFSVHVKSFEGLTYRLLRSDNLDEPFIPVTSPGASAHGSGQMLKLIDDSEKRRGDKGFYKISVERTCKLQ